MEKTVRRCGIEVRWQLRCPRSWDALTPTPDADVRHCGECNERVYFCRDDHETLAQARAGHCIAREEPSEDALPRIVLGRSVVIRQVTDAQEAALAHARRERGIADALRAEGTSPACPACGYAMPRFRRTCYVCGHEAVPA